MSVGEDEAEVEIAHFGAEGTSAGAARRFVSATLAAWGVEALDDAATLLASELVANAVLHAGTDLDVVLRRPEGRVRVEVHDRDHRLPVRKHYSVTATTGRGLGLLEDLARAWGADVTPDGKVVWFELDETTRSPDTGPRLGTEVPFAPMFDAELSLDDLEDLFDLDTGPPASGAESMDEPNRHGPADADRALALSSQS